jgi:hypothetical protein
MRFIKLLGTCATSIILFNYAHASIPNPTPSAQLFQIISADSLTKNEWIGTPIVLKLQIRNIYLVKQSVCKSKSQLSLLGKNYFNLLHFELELSHMEQSIKEATVLL